MTETRKLAAILAADVVGYSRLAGADEDRTLARLRALRSDLIDPTIAVHNGRVVKRTGDGSLIEFRSVVDAVRCAIGSFASCSVEWRIPPFPLCPASSTGRRDTRGQLAINNDDGLPNARPNAFSESIRNQLSRNVICSATRAPPRNP